MRVEQRGGGRRQRIEETWTGRGPEVADDNEFVRFTQRARELAAGTLRFRDGIVE